jgi:hypothetical protein
MQNPRLKRPQFKMYQQVILVCESAKDDVFGEPTIVRKGQKGVIVLICQTPDVPSIGYAVEFFDKKGETVAVSIVEENDIAALPDGSPDVKVAKRRKNKSKSRAA